MPCIHTSENRRKRTSQKKRNQPTQEPRDPTRNTPHPTTTHHTNNQTITHAPQVIGLEDVNHQVDRRLEDALLQLRLPAQWSCLRGLGDGAEGVVQDFGGGDEVGGGQLLVWGMWIVYGGLV